MKVSLYLLRDSPFAARSNAGYDLVPIDPLPVIRTVWLFEAHVAFVVYAVFWVHQHARSDSGIQYAVGDGQLVAQDTTDNKLEGVFEDFFPAVRAASFSLVAWMCKAEFTNGEVWVAFDRRAFEGERLVEVENAAKQHSLRVAFEAVVRVGAVIMAICGSWWCRLFVGIPVVQFRGW